MGGSSVPFDDIQSIGHYMHQDSHTIDELLKYPQVDAQLLFIKAAGFNLVDKMEEIWSNHTVDVNGFCNIAEDRPLPAATLGNSVKAMKWLLDHGADPNSCTEDFLDDGTKDEASCLWLAAQVGNIRSASLLLNAGANANTFKKSTGISAIFIAAQHGYKAMLSLLLSHGADPDMRKLGTNGRLNATPVLLAAASIHCDVVAQLINSNANFSDHLEFLKETLHRIRREGKTEIPGYLRKVTGKEIDVLEELLDPSRVKKLMSNPAYEKARRAERKGNYRDALKLLQSVPSSLAKVQLQLDIDRNIEFVYGMKGSDGRMAMWTILPHTKDQQPDPLQFNAWTRVGNKLYIHGGYDFMCTNLSMRRPLKDEVWELDLGTQRWRLLQTIGETPGPRSGHGMFAYKNYLYIWGGNRGADPSPADDSKLYRLDLSQSGSYNWEVVKTKSSLRPRPRKEFAGVLYKGKYYITAGTVGRSGQSDELWCLSLSNMKWQELKHDSTKRYNHRMWAARGKLFVLGGRTMENGFDPHTAEHSIDDFHSYDIEKKTWSKIPICGDKPYDISEYCVLPIFCGKEGTEEPSAVIVWGGYSALDQTKGEVTSEIMQSRYSDEARDFCIPYRKRLLRYDIDLNVWTLLQPSHEVLPKAESFAAEIETRNGQVKLLIGGGYGFIDDSSKMQDLPKEADPLCKAVFEDMKEKNGGGFTPKASKNMYEVAIADVRDMCSVKNDFIGKSWAWNFFDLGQKRPTVNAFISAFSPTLHHIIDLTHEDFQDPPCDVVNPNDEETLLGVRLKLHGLEGRADLNGAIGRCGSWLKEKERYQIFLPSYDCGPCPVSVKPSNLLVAEPFSTQDYESSVIEIVKSSSKRHSPAFPAIMMSVVTPRDISKLKPSLLDSVFSDDESFALEEYINITDTYRGPISRQAHVILKQLEQNGIGKCIGDTFSLILLSAGAKNMSEKGKKAMKAMKPLTNFYKRLKEKDSRRVLEFEKHLKRSCKGVDLLCEWFKITVQIDGINPPIEREILVSPGILMQELHHQVLCPSIGWTNNYHAYAFRRIPKECVVVSNHTVEEEAKAMNTLNNECWIGPKSSTARDIMFQPLFIGGAIANDKKITLGDLFEQSMDSKMYLQYVHDFGDWWVSSFVSLELVI